MEYDRLVEHGLFATGERVELLGGLLVVREPQGGRHAMGVRMVEEALRAAFGSGWDVRGRLPVALDAEPEPEDIVTLRSGETVVALAAPDTVIAVADLVP